MRLLEKDSTRARILDFEDEFIVFDVCARNRTQSKTIINDKNDVDVMLSNFDLDYLLEKIGYTVLKKGKREKKIPVGSLVHRFAPNFDSVGECQRHLVNLELMNPAKRSQGGTSSGSSSLQMGRMDKFYQLCEDRQVKKGLLVFVLFERASYYKTAVESRPRRLRALKKFKRSLPGGSKIFKLIDVDIIPIPYGETVDTLFPKIVQCLLNHGMPSPQTVL